MNASRVLVNAELICSVARSELARRGLGLADFERVGVTVDRLEREILRVYRERGCGSLAGIVEAVVARVGLAAPKKR